MIIRRLKFKVNEHRNVQGLVLELYRMLRSELDDVTNLILEKSHTFAEQGGPYCRFLCVCLNMCVSKPTLLRGSTDSFVVVNGVCGLFFLCLSKVCIVLTREIQSTAVFMKALPFVLSHGLKVNFSRGKPLCT